MMTVIENPRMAMRDGVVTVEGTVEGERIRRQLPFETFFREVAAVVATRPDGVLTEAVRRVLAA